MNEQIKKFKKNSKNALFDNYSERDLIIYLVNKVQELESKIELYNEIPDGFFTLSKAQAEIWDNKEEDEWSKYI